MRLMSFSITTLPIQTRAKTVTRRVGWTVLKPGDVIQPVDKVMGMKPGEHPRPIGGPIRVVDVRRERLDRIGQADVAREGFRQMTPAEFVVMFSRSHRGCLPQTVVTRIEFEFVNTCERFGRLVDADSGEVLR